MYIRKYN